ncbi:MAG: peptide chain release factor N(5)-glutamine methyltransferase [bacterium]
MLFAPGTRRLAEILHDSAEYLAQNGIENARLNAERLLAHLLQVNRPHLYLDSEHDLTTSKLEQLANFLRRRARQEPLQHILGETEFMSLPFKVSPAVLIPRPETEVLVEGVLKRCEQMFSPTTDVAILDVGTGSGCIAVSLAKYLKNAEVTALDISAEALHAAAANAALNRVSRRIKFANIDFFRKDIVNRLSAQFDVVVSNPPYVSVADFDDLPAEVKHFEPTIALHDQADGLRFYRRISEVARQLLKPVGFWALEVGTGQAPVVRDMMLKSGFARVKVNQDLNGIDRVLICDRDQEHRHQPFLWRK